MGRKYRILVGESPEMLAALANKDGWAILSNTVRGFETLDLDCSDVFDEAGDVAIDGSGFVCLSFKEE